MSSSPAPLLDELKSRIRGRLEQRFKLADPDALAAEAVDQLHASNQLQQLPPDQQEERAFQQAAGIVERLRNERLQGLRERILSFATSRVGREAAEDIAQETLMTYLEKYSEVVELKDMVPLSVTIASFKVKTVWRQGRRVSPDSIEDMALVDPSPGPALDWLNKQIRERLAKALTSKRVPPRCKKLWEYKLEGYSFEEIRRLMNAPSVQAVYNWDFRCKQRVQEILGGSFLPGGRPK